MSELESALSQAEPGEAVYLTIVTVGLREQVRVNLPRLGCGRVLANGSAHLTFTPNACLIKASKRISWPSSVASPPVSRGHAGGNRKSSCRRGTCSHRCRRT